METRHPRARIALAVAAALSVAIVWHVIGRIGRATWPPPSPFAGMSLGYWRDSLTLTFAILLVMPAPKASGLIIGSIREHWKPTFLVCALPILVAIAAIPYLRELPWHGQSSSIWTIQPLAQDLVFFGFVYRLFDSTLSGPVVSGLPVGRPLVATAVVFSAWHLPNWGFLGPADLAVQVAYTFAGACLVGLARQWTGSLLYGLGTHMAVNYVAWAAA